MVNFAITHNILEPTCECNKNSRGSCGAWDHDGLWCMVKYPSNCGDRDSAGRSKALCKGTPLFS